MLETLDCFLVVIEVVKKVKLVVTLKLHRASLDLLVVEVEGCSRAIVGQKHGHFGPWVLAHHLKWVHFFRALYDEIKPDLAWPELNPKRSRSRDLVLEISSTICGLPQGFCTCCPLCF